MKFGDVDNVVHGLFFHIQAKPCKVGKETAHSIDDDFDSING